MSILFLLAIFLVCTSSLIVAQQQTTSTTFVPSNTTTNVPTDDDDTEDPWQKTEAYRDVLVVTAVLCGISIITMIVLVLTKLAIEGNKGGFKSKQAYRRDAQMLDNDYVAYVEKTEVINDNNDDQQQQERETSRMSPRESAAV